jgi:hypothetical protein
VQLTPYSNTQAVNIVHAHSQEFADLLRELATKAHFEPMTGRFKLHGKRKSKIKIELDFDLADE